MKESVKAYRLVCHLSGYPGHNEHVFTYSDKDRVIEMQRRKSIEWGASDTTKRCTPFHVEVQWTSPWEEYVEEEES